MQYWTDYPIAELGDEPGKKAPIRQAFPIAYDGNKYVTVRIEEGDRVVVKEIKYVYLYTRPVRAECADGHTFPPESLLR
jgi:hypothetical protein